MFVYRRTMILGGDHATATAEPTPVDHALDQLLTSLDHLVKLTRLEKVAVLPGLTGYP